MKEKKPKRNLQKARKKARAKEKPEAKFTTSNEEKKTYDSHPDDS